MEIKVMIAAFGGMARSFKTRR